METFIAAYRNNLEKAVREKPEDYPWYPATSVESVADKMQTRCKQQSAVDPITKQDGHSSSLAANLASNTLTWRSMISSPITDNLVS